MMILRTVAIGAFLALMAAATVSQAASLQVKVDHDRIVIEADRLNQVAGLDLDLRYELAAFRVSRVEEGALFQGSLLVPNTGQDGRVRIGLVRGDPVSGSGVVLVIYGSQIVGDRTVLKSMTAIASDRRGNTSSLPVTILSGNADNEPSSPSPQSTTTSGRGGLRSFQTPVNTRQPTQSPPNSTPPARTPLQATHSSDQTARPTPASTADYKPLLEDPRYQKGILDAFRAYEGEPSAENFLALFQKGLEQVVPQVPPIAVSDGKTEVTVMLNGFSSSPRDYAIRGGKIVSKRMTPDGPILKILPHKDHYEVIVVLLEENKIIPLHLTVVPPVNADFDSTSVIGIFSSLDSYLKSEEFDFNGDGVADTVDIYSFIGNYLLRNINVQKNKKEERDA